MKAKLLRRNAYDIGHEDGVVENEQPGLNAEDTSTPLSQHKTPINPVNMIRDPDAELEFPGLGDHAHRFPGRGRG
jgi:hypothetical protein